MLPCISESTGIALAGVFLYSRVVLLLKQSIISTRNFLDLKDLITLTIQKIFLWLTRRHAHLQRTQQGIPVSEVGVLVDLVRVPDWAFDAAGQEMRVMAPEAAAYQPGIYLNPAQVNK